MINVLVSYTVKPEYVEENITNIKNFLEDFKHRISLSLIIKFI